jgi:hypothetical protein
MAITERDIDKETLSTAKYIEKYYSDVDLSGWDLWMNDTINKIWDKNQREDFLKSWGERMVDFNFLEMERFYRDEDLSLFDEDVKKFISFLAGDGFFKTNKISFKSWVDSKKFTNPIKDFIQDVTINQALELKGGMNYIRKQLVNLHWWRQ